MSVEVIHERTMSGDWLWRKGITSVALKWNPDTGKFLLVLNPMEADGKFLEILNPKFQYAPNLRAAKKLAKEFFFPLVPEDFPLVTEE